MTAGPSQRPEKFSEVWPITYPPPTTPEQHAYL
jgi:hypothetical protein